MPNWRDKRWVHSTDKKQMDDVMDGVPFGLYRASPESNSGGLFTVPGPSMWMQMDDG